MATRTQLAKNGLRASLPRSGRGTTTDSRPKGWLKRKEGTDVYQMNIENGNSGWKL